MWEEEAEETSPSKSPSCEIQLLLPLVMTNSAGDSALARACSGVDVRSIGYGDFLYAPGGGDLETRRVDDEAHVASARLHWRQSTPPTLIDSSRPETAALEKCSNRENRGMLMPLFSSATTML